MILVVLIILFIILLLCKYRLFAEEKYTINSLGIDWRNKAGVSESVNKWILVLYDKDGTNIHQTEDKSPQNLQNFMDVSLNAIENKKFGSEIIGTNTLSVYYNSISDDTKVYSGEVSLDANDFTASVSDITAKDSDIPTWGELKGSAETLDEILGEKDTKIYAYPKGGIKDLYKCINTNACNIYDPKWWVRKTCFIQELGFEKTGDTGYFYPHFPSLGHTHKYFGVNSSKEVKMTCWDDDKCSPKKQKFYLEKPEGVTDTDTVKYGRFVYKDTNGDKNYLYVSGNDKLKVAKLTDISDTSSTIFEFRYSKDCESYWENVKKDKVGGKWKFGSEVYDCGPNNIHDCQRWEHVRVDAIGEGKACPSDMKPYGHVIKTQWPKETTIYELNKNFPTYIEKKYADIISENTDPNKNETVGIKPQYYKNEYDTLNASINLKKEQKQLSTKIPTGFKWFYYDKHLKTKSEFSGQTPSRSGEGITDLSWKNIIKELGISGTPSSDQGPTARQRITGGVAGNYGSNYSIHFTGTYIPQKSGTYEFQTTSDDMSFLYIDDDLIVDNGGLHWFVEKQGKKTLTSGKVYKIDIYFSEKGGDDGIDVEIKRPGDGNWSHIFMENATAIATATTATPINQDCEGHWINDPTGRSNSSPGKNYKTVKWVETKKKYGNGKDCKWAFTRKNPHIGATDVPRNWAGWAFGGDQWISEVVTDGQKGEVFNYQNSRGFRMDDTYGEDWEKLGEWKQNYLRFCMRKPNVDEYYSRNIKGRYKDGSWNVYTDAYGTRKFRGTCDDDDD